VTPADRLTLRDRPPTLAACRDTPIEWWFVQGVIDGPEAPALHFMAAFFQVRASDRDAPPAQMLLVHLLDGDGTPRRVLSRITPDIPDAHRMVAARVIEARFPAPLAGYLLQRHMSAAHRIAAEGGVTVEPRRARVAGDRLAIDWGDFSLHETEAGFDVVLPGARGFHGEPDSGVGVGLRARLVPARPWLCETGDRLTPDWAPPYRYYSCPRLDLVGSQDGRPVTGRAWIDRQWGDSLDNWFVGERAGVIRPLGWDWLGLSLDNGADLLAIEHRVVGDGADKAGCVVCMTGADACRLDGRLDGDGDALWRSLRSGAAYPVARRLVLPALSADLEISPVARDQEIPVFGLTAIWEGAVRAKGTMQGRPVAGFGRLELFGYGYPEGVMDVVTRRIARSFA